MIIGYARVSTEDQNLAMQLDALTKAGCEKIFQEKISSTKAQRPGLEEAMKHLRKGDMLMVWKLDRLGRSMKELIHIITSLDQRGVDFKSIHENIDTTTPVGKLTFHIFCSLAEFEREIIRQRTVEGLQAARSRKKVLGRAKGLSKIAQQKAFTASALSKEGSLRPIELCQQLNISLPTLYRYLHHHNITLKMNLPNFEVANADA